MKTSNYLPVAIAALAFNSGIAFGNVLQHPLTLKLTFERNGGEIEKETATSTNYSQKKITEKVSNKELLGLYVERGIIEEITGWSIVGASLNDYDFGGEVEGIYLVKKGEEPINISDNFYTEDSEEIEVETYNWTYNNETETWKGTETDTYEVDFYFDFEDEEGEIEFTLAAIATESAAYDEEEDTGILSSYALTDGSGSFYDVYNEEVGVVRGSMSFGKGAASVIEFDL